MLLLLDQCTEDERDLVKLILWKTWSRHNNITHQEGPISISEGVHALCSMQPTLLALGTEEIDRKGKASSSPSGNGKQHRSVTRGQERNSKCEPPPVGQNKCRWFPDSGDAGIGVIARHSSGQVIFTAWRVLFRCQDAVESKARACLEGLHLASQWVQAPVIIESDCARIVQALREREERSAISFILSEARDHATMLEDWSVVKVKRECNRVANELAHLARRSMHTTVWLGRAPACVEAIVVSDCTPST